MTIEEVLCARLVAQVTSVSGRVFPVRAAQDTPYPFLVYGQVSEVTPHAFGSDVNALFARWSVTAWGTSYTDAKVAADQVSTALSRYRATVSGLEVLDVFKELELDLFDDAALAYHVAQDFLVMHRN
jgi:hypothetical protein